MRFSVYFFTSASYQKFFPFALMRRNTWFNVPITKPSHFNWPLTNVLGWPGQTNCHTHKCGTVLPLLLQRTECQWKQSRRSEPSLAQSHYCYTLFPMMQPSADCVPYPRSQLHPSPSPDARAYIAHVRAMH